ncbi:MAG: carboxypeptidase regulatory-like domain-containing protein [Gammaproteobacteria bacterium]|nr:carboxypeptidase regulatory-like domain-containing protein [Gammaproteobacteria bacterium]
MLGRAAQVLTTWFDGRVGRLAGDSPDAGFLAFRRALRTAIAAQKTVNLLPLPSVAQREQMACWQQRAGMRRWPFPFASAMAITSDTDFTNRDRYRSCIAALVEAHGLDFGDSLWLTSLSGRYPGHELPGLGLLSPDFRIDAGHCERERAWQPDLYALLAEHHLGNIDHWHGFTDRGPRVILLDGLVRVSARLATVALPRRFEHELLLHHAGNFWPLAVSVLGSPALVEAITEIVAVSRDGAQRWRYARERNTGLYPFLRAAADAGGEGLAFFTTMYEVRADTAPPCVDDVDRLEIVLGATAALDGARVYLHNVHAEMLLDRLQFINDEFHFSTNLCTTHGRWHFYTANRLRVENERNGALLRGQYDPSWSYYGAFDEPGLRFSTLADDERSFARVLPAIRDRFGIVFLRLIQGRRYAARSLDPAASEGGHCSVFNVVYPVASRAGDGLYNLCAAFPPLPPPWQDEPALDPQRTRAASFQLRLGVVLEELRASPGEAAVLYTHLGHWGDPPYRREPDFRAGATVTAKDRHYNVSGTCTRSERLWFTRASVLAGYACMAQTVAGATRRRAKDRIEIASWHDPVLGMRLPQHEDALYGLTYYVEDAQRARVLLDGRELHDLIRNPADETGRPSVTLAACGIRHVVFDEVDPRGRSGADSRVPWCASNAQWIWRGDAGTAYHGRYSARLSLDGPAGSGSIDGRIEFSGHGVRPHAAQVLYWAMARSAARVRFAVVLVTAGGGRFFFGARELSPIAGALTAAYWLADTGRQPRHWHRIAIPLYDLEWFDGDPARVAMPSQPLERVTLLARGRPGDWVDLDRMEFGRPKPTRAQGAGDTLVLGGRVRADVTGAAYVALRPLFEPDSAPRLTRADALGGFWFNRLPPGAYQLARAESADAVDWRNAIVVDANSSRFDLSL